MRARESYLPVVRGTSTLSPLHVLEDIAFVISGRQLEGQGCVMALQHRSVVIQNGQLAASVAQE